LAKEAKNMIRITVDALATKQLREIIEPCEIYDPAGNKLGAIPGAARWRRFFAIWNRGDEVHRDLVKARGIAFGRILAAR
jgi:hypothetical protein